MKLLKVFYLTLALATFLASCGDDDGDSPNVSAGMITGGPFSFTVDGTPDFVTGVATDGNGVGSNMSWIITDADDNILGLPGTTAALEGVDFDEAGSGVCFIWYIRYEGDLTGFEVGESLDGIQGDFAISNSIRVDRTLIGLDGGMVSFADGSTTAVGVTGTDQLTFTGITTTSTATDASYWYIVTDDNDLILDFVNPDDRNNATVDISGAPAGVCRIWGWSYKGLDDPVRGDNISTLNDEELEEISDNFITVTRETPDGGTVSLADGSTTAVGVTGSDQLSFSGVTTDSEAGNLSYWYIVTDDNDLILDFVNPDDRNNATVDISGAPDGVCRIWGWSYRGLDDPIRGENISTLNDDPEEEISDNFITVTRESPDGGMVSLADGSTTAVGVTGSTQLSFSGVTTNSEATNLSYWYIVTDDNDLILDFVNPDDRNNATVDISGAPDGVCRIWGWSYRGLDDPVRGENISTLNDDPVEEISDNFITVTRESPDGGMVTLSDGSTSASGTAGTSELTFSGVTTNSAASNLSYWYIVTDDNDIILDFVNPADRNNATVDLSGAPTGVCRIWGWSYRGLGDPVRGDNISTLDDDPVEEISDNFITVTRN